MAIMIPQHPSGSIEVVNKFYQNLHLQLGPEYKISQYLDSAFTVNGTLLWLKYKSRSLFIYVSNLTEEELEINKTTKIRRKVLQSQILACPEIKKLVRYKQSLLPDTLKLFHAQLTPLIVISSNVSKKQLNIQLKSQGISILGKELLESENLKNILVKFAGSPCSKKIMQHIQKSFHPETKVTHNDHNYLLDQEQETAIKIDIDNKKMDFQNYNLCGVNGGSYSGKSEVILLRTRLLNTLNPEKNILVLTSNEVSREDLLQRFSLISPQNVDKKIQILSFHKWCETQLSTDQKTIDDIVIKNTISNVVLKHLGENKINLSVFLRELNFIQGHVIQDEESYLQKRNASQLSNELHKNIWLTRHELNKILKEQNVLLRSDLPKLLWEANHKGKAIDTYDHILIDDAHHFSPLAFEIIKKALKPNTGQLFISQDPQQELLTRLAYGKIQG